MKHFVYIVIIFLAIIILSCLFIGCGSYNYNLEGFDGSTVSSELDNLFDSDDSSSNSQKTEQANDTTASVPSVPMPSDPSNLTWCPDFSTDPNTCSGNASCFWFPNPSGTGVCLNYSAGIMKLNPALNPPPQ